MNEGAAVAEIRDRKYSRGRSRGTADVAVASSGDHRRSGGDRAGQVPLKMPAVSTSDSRPMPVCFTVQRPLVARVL